MNINRNVPPRRFKVGKNSEITITDVASITLNDDEQVTFINKNKELDVCRKKWGFYATPSTNNRLKSFGYSTCICKNESGSIYILIVDENYKDDFCKYIDEQKMIVLSWLDDDYLAQTNKFHDDK